MKGPEKNALAPLSQVSPNQVSLSHRDYPGDRRQESWRIVEMTPLIDIRNLKGVIFRNLPLLILMPLLTIGASLVFLYCYATHYYDSKAMIMIDPEFHRILQIEKGANTLSDLDSLNSLELAILSDTMILRVIDRLGLRNDKDFLPKRLHEFSDREFPLNGPRLLKEVRNRYSAGIVRPTRLLELTVYDTDAARAQLLAATFLSEFEIFLGEQTKEEANTALAGLRSQAEDAFDRALMAEAQLNKYRASVGVILEQDHDLAAERLSRSGEGLNEAISQLITVKSRYESIQHIDPQNDPVRVITVGNFSQLEHVSDLMSERTTALSGLATIRHKFTPRHPQYIEAQNRVFATESQLRQLAGDLKLALAADFQAALKNEEALQSQLANMQGDLTEVKSASSEFRALKQIAETEWAVHESLQLRIAETKLSSNVTTSIAKRVSEPMAGYKTTKPKKSLVVAIGGILGCMMSLGVVAIGLLRDGPFASRFQIEDQLQLPVLVEISKSVLKKSSSDLTKSISEIILNNRHPGCQSFHIMSSATCENKASMVADAIADVSAYYRAETVLVKICEGEPSEVFELAPVETAIRGLYHIELPSSLLLTDNAWQILSKRCADFKRIIIDSSSLDPDSQLAIYFGKLAQQNLLVVDKKKDRRSKALKTVRSFQNDCDQPLSIVMVG